MVAAGRWKSSRQYLQGQMMRILSQEAHFPIDPSGYIYFKSCCFMVELEAFVHLPCPIRLVNFER